MKRSLPGLLARERARRAATAFALFWALNAWSQVAAPSLASGFHIAGRVVNSSTGEPVARASVVAHSDDSRIVAAAMSDADGKFSIENLPAGKYPLSASKRGYRSAFYDEHEEFNSAIVTGEGLDTEHLEFTLVPAATLHGVITADGGDPVEGADVMLFRQPNLSHASEGPVQADGAMTDDTGAYEFSDLSAGEYFVAVKADPWYALHGRSNRNADGSASILDVAYPITFFDSTVDEAAAVPIKLAEGSREEANISLHAVPALHLRLLDTAPKNGARSIELRETLFGKEIQTRGMLAVQRGNIETTGIAPGHYELTHGDPPRTIEFNASSDLEIESDAGTAAVSVRGTLRTSGGAAIADEANLLLEPEDGPGRTRLQTFAQKGQFVFEGVLPGRWSISVYAGPEGQSLPVVSIASGQHALPGNEIVVADRPVNIAVAVSRTQTRIQGFARLNGKPASGVLVVLVPHAPGAYVSLVRRDQSDSDGSFSLRDVAPGQYTVIAIDDGWKLDWRKREAIVPYLAGGVPVTISDRSNPVVQLPKVVSAVSRSDAATGPGTR